MTTSPTSPVPESSETAPDRTVPAWVVFCFAVTVEYLVMSSAFDARDLLVPAGLQQVLGRIGEIAPLAFLFPAAVFLTGGLTVRLRLRSLSAYREEFGWTSTLTIAHIALFAGSVSLARWITAFDSVPVLQARIWVLGWLGAMMASLAALIFALWSPGMIVDALRGLWRQLAIGLFVSSAAWAFGLLSRRLWEPLAWLTLELVHALLTVIATDPVASIEQSLVGTSRFYVEVAPACSGIEGIALMLIFVGAYLFMQRRELLWPRSLILLPLSVIFVWLLNTVRVTALIAVGTWYSPEVALGGFHSKAGWVFFALSALGTVYLVQQWKAFRVSPSNASADPVGLASGEAGHGTNTPTVDEGSLSDNGAATAAYLAPMLAVLAAKLLTGLATSGFDYLYAVSVFAAAFALFKFRRHYPTVSFGSPWLPLTSGAAIAALWIVGFSPDGASSTIATGLTSLPVPLAALWLAVRAFGSVVTIPIVEELAFRGYLLRRFSSPHFEAVPYRRFSWLGLIASSLCFGALHSQLGLGIVAGFAFGLLAAARGRLSDAVIAHGTANAGIVIYVLMTGEFSLIA